MNDLMNYFLFTFFLFSFEIQALECETRIKNESNCISTLWWDMNPTDVRETINKRIMNIEAPTPSVWCVENRVITNAIRSTSVRVYFPSNSKNLPTILLIHGGAWVAGNLDTHDNLARYLCSQAKALVIAVDYINAPEGKFPLQLEQCFDALTWIIENANELFADSSRLAIVGDSAGGNMAAALCLMVRDQLGPKIDLQVLINPAMDLRCNGTLEEQNDELDILRWQAAQYLSDPNDANNPYVSPLITCDLSRLPQTLMLVAEKDGLRIEGENYAQRLANADVLTTVYCQKGIGHLAGDCARASVQARESLDVAVDALKRVFHKK